MSFLFSWFEWFAIVSWTEEQSLNLSVFFREDFQHGCCRSQTLYSDLLMQVLHILEHFTFLTYLFFLRVISIDYFSDYIEAVSNWLAVLLTKIRPWMYVNGGNIITVQVVPIIISYLFLIVKYLPMNMFCT